MSLSIAVVSVVTTEITDVTVDCSGFSGNKSTEITDVTVDCSGFSGNESC